MDDLCLFSIAIIANSSPHDKGSLKNNSQNAKSVSRRTEEKYFLISFTAGRSLCFGEMLAPSQLAASS